MPELDIIDKIKNTKIIIESELHPVVVYQEGRKHACYYDLKTGIDYKTKDEMQRNIKNNQIFTMRCNDTPIHIYVNYIKYYKEINCLAISTLSIKSNKPSVANEIRDWKIVDTIWITNEKKIIHINANGEAQYITKQKDIPININISVLQEKATENNVMLEFSKLFPSNNEINIPVFFYEKNSCNDIKKLSTLFSFLFFKDSEVTTGPKQKKIDILGSKLTKVNKIPNYSDTITLQMNIFKFEKINDTYSAVRIFYVDKIYNIFEETMRIFLSKKEIITARKNYKNEFVNVRTGISDKYILSMNSYLLDFEEKDILNTKFEYYKDFIFDIPKEIRSFMVIFLIKYPIIEKLYKLGLGKYINYGYSNIGVYPDNILKPLNDIFSAKEENSNNVMKYLGMTNYQLSKMLAADNAFDSSLQLYDQYFIFSEIKKIIGKTDITFIDENTFNMYLISYNTYQNYQGPKAPLVKIERTLRLVSRLYSPQTESMLASKIFMLAITPIERNGRSMNDFAINYYYDYINIVNIIDDANNFRGTFSSVDDVKNMHDNLLELYNLRKQEYAIKKFNKQKPKWEDFTYENNNYVVKYPEKPEELAREGIELHHCVKSYIDRVSNGITNLLFIRKVSEPDKPFFTVEISNDGFIEQVHGFGNRNATTEPGLEDFIREWKTKTNLKTRNYNKIR